MYAERSFLGGLLAAVAATLAGGVPALADTRALNGPVAAEVLRVVDGDTVEVSARIWPQQTVTTLVRIHGIDAPELRGRCRDEIDKATQARDFVASLAPIGGMVGLYDVRTGKFAGRVLAAVRTAEGRDLAQELLRTGLARPYDGRGRRASWCPDTDG